MSESGEKHQSLFPKAQDEEIFRFTVIEEGRNHKMFTFYIDGIGEFWLFPLKNYSKQLFDYQNSH